MGREEFTDFIIPILSLNRVLNNIPGIFQYLSINATQATLRNNELVSSIDFEIDTSNPNLFEAAQLTNIFTLEKDENWRISEYGVKLDLRWPDIPNISTCCNNNSDISNNDSDEDGQYDSND